MMATVLALALMVGVVQHRRALFASQDLGDEAAYLCAFRAANQGANPYNECPRYLYLPGFAQAGGYLSSVVGIPVVRGVLRALVLAGSAVVSSAAAVLTGWPLGVQVVVAAGLMLSPPITEGIEFGNISSLVAALAMGTLFWLYRRPVLAGVLLACGLCAKPMLLIVPVAIFAAPHGDGRRPAGLALTVAMLLSALGILPWVKQLSVLAMVGGLQLHAHHNISVVRVFAELGLTLSAPAVAAVCALIAVVALRVRPADAMPMRRRRLMLVALCGSSLASPIVWNHTLSLLFPVLTLACSVGLARARADWDSPRRARALLPLGGIVLAVEIILQSDTVGDLGLPPGAWQAMALCLPLFAPAALAFYVESQKDTGVWCLESQSLRARARRSCT